MGPGPALGGAGARSLEAGHIQQPEDTQADAGDAGPDPPAVGRRDIRPDRKQDDQGDHPPRGYYPGDELIVGLERLRAGATGAAHVLHASLPPRAWCTWTAPVNPRMPVHLANGRAECR